MRSWSRRSDPDASKRSKVPEHPPIAPPTGPSAPSVIEGLSTVEVRWILPGQLDAAVAGWFGRFPAGLDSREDIYLIHPVLRGLSVKIRAGQLLEVKQHHGSPGILDAAGRARGRIESWRKWSFPFGSLGRDRAGPPGWTVVHKRRWMSRFRLVGGRLMADVAERATGSECGVELTEVRSAGETWWVHLAVGRLVRAREGRERQPRQHRTIHPRKGEESPARRRQDQSPSPDQRRHRDQRREGLRDMGLRDYPVSHIPCHRGSGG